MGGLAWPTRAAAHALAAAFDVVVIETVGVGQAETEIVDVADTVAVVVQPGSGDALQFLKSGIMEIPDVLVVTKADLGQLAYAHPARSERGPALARLALHARARGLLASTASGHRRAGRGARGAPRRPRPRRAATTRAPASALVEYTHEHGERGLRALGGRRAAEALLAEQDPGLDVPALVAALERRIERLTMARDLLMIFGAFVVASLLAGALGATNLGTALAFGQMALAATTVYVILKR